MVCTSLGSLLRLLFYFLDDVSYPQSVLISCYMHALSNGMHHAHRLVVSLFPFSLLPFYC